MRRFISRNHQNTGVMLYSGMHTYGIILELNWSRAV